MTIKFKYTFVWNTPEKDHDISAEVVAHLVEDNETGKDTIEEITILSAPEHLRDAILDHLHSPRGRRLILDAADESIADGDTVALDGV